MATGRAQRDPSGDLCGTLSPVKRDKHFIATNDQQKVGKLRKMECADVNLDTAEWAYFVTKTEAHHIVPLARQAVETLREIHPLKGYGKYVLYGDCDHDRPMSDKAIHSALRRLGWSNDPARFLRNCFHYPGQHGVQE